MNRATTIALVLVFAALALYVVLVQQPRTRAEAEATPAGNPVSYVFTVSADQVRELRVAEPGAGRALTLRQDDSGVWTLAEPEALPADPVSAQMAASQITGLFVNTTITTTTDLASFGVLDPAYTLELTLADGVRLRAAVGDLAPTGANYYVLREGEPHVLVVGSSGINSLVALLDAPPLPPTELPPLEPEVTAEPEAHETPGAEEQGAETDPAPTATPAAPTGTP